MSGNETHRWQMGSSSMRIRPYMHVASAIDVVEISFAIQERADLCKTGLHPLATKRRSLVTPEAYIALPPGVE
jgi:hypothetical protein